ncbi:MAG TPA: response regulator transcription factor [Vicinamibacteria bacterium]|nr:response regulator transcription factor [Vicinamibacteria bacterium]
MAATRRVLLVGDDHLALEGMARLLDEAGGWSIAGENEDDPDAVVVDLDADEAADRLRSLAHRHAVLAIASDALRSREALAFGARGVVSRNATGARFARALDAVLEGLVVVDEDFAEDVLRPPWRPLGSEEALTPREIEVLQCLALGLSNKEIAGRLGVSYHTVKFHVNSILGKLGASSRTEVVAIAARAGLLTF